MNKFFKPNYTNKTPYNHNCSNFRAVY